MTSTIMGHTLKGPNYPEIQRYFNMNKLRKYDKIILQKSHNGNLRKAFYELQILKYKLNLPDTIIENIAYLYRKINQKKIFRYSKISSVLYAVTYTVCRELGVIHSINEISDICNIKKSEISKFYRKIVLELDIKVPLFDPIKCILKIANKISLNEKYKSIAIKIMRWFLNNNSKLLLGKNPIITAAAIIYHVSSIKKENISQRTIALNSGISEASIRKRLGEIREVIDKTSIA